MPGHDSGICAAPPCLARALGGLACAAVLLAILALNVGAGPVWPSGGSTWAEWRTSPAAALLWEWRAPRVAMAFLVGACLAMSGLIFQGVFRNPLAEPYLLGSAAGAGLGAACAMLLPEFLPRGIGLPLLAFVGAWGSSLAVLMLGAARPGTGTGRLLLAGVALAAILAALRSLIVLLFGDESTNLRALVSWQMGGIQTPTWREWGVLLGVTLSILGLCRRLGPGLDALGLGEEMAHSMGIRVPAFCRRAIVVAALATAVAVAWGGLIGFVGLIVPHLARWWLGPLHARLAPAVALAGGALMVLVDAVARSALPPSEIPAGLLTALIGGPFFLFLLLREGR